MPLLLPWQPSIPPCKQACQRAGCPLKPGRAAGPNVHGSRAGNYFCKSQTCGIRDAAWLASPPPKTASATPCGAPAETCEYAGNALV